MPSLSSASRALRSVFVSDRDRTCSSNLQDRTNDAPAWETLKTGLPLGGGGERVSVDIALFHTYLQGKAAEKQTF